MHPRNPYVNPPDFAALGEKYPFLRPYVMLNRQGRGYIDFKNRNALWALTRVLLQEDFGLDVLIPEDALVPTLTLRLNYILWIEDLLKRPSTYMEHFSEIGAVETPGAGVEDEPDNAVGVVEKPTSASITEQAKSAGAGEFSKEATSSQPSNPSCDVEPARPIKGLDIGTGASAVFVLLGSKKNDWEMIGTDIKPESIQFAKRNVERNGLEMLAKVQLTDGTSSFGCILDADKSIILDFTMCNPPFFSSEEEADSTRKSRRSDRPPPSGAKTGSSTELARDGGEVELITKMIKESINYATRVRIFSTMVGVKRHLDEIVRLLKSPEMTGEVQWHEVTQFQQGKTMRWGLAWSFYKVDKPIKPSISEIKLPIVEKVPNSQSSLNPLQNLMFTFYKKSLATLGFKFISIGELNFEVICEKNTWSHQRSVRRAKRQMERTISEVTPGNSSEQAKEPANKVPRIESTTEVEEKASLNQEEEPTNKVPVVETPKKDEEASISDQLARLNEQLQSLIQYCTLADYEGKQYGLHFLATGLPDEEGLTIQFELYGGTFGKEGIRQVKEYIQNLVFRSD